MAQPGIGFTSQVGFLSSPETNDPCHSGMDELSFRMSCIGKPDAWNEGPLDESKVEIIYESLARIVGLGSRGSRLDLCDGPRLDGGRWKVGTPCTSSKRPGPFFSFWVPIVTGPDQKISDAASAIFLVGKCGSRGSWLDIVHIWIRSVSDFHYSVCFGPRHFSGLFCFSLGIRV